MDTIYTEDVFMDSGAWALCRLYVLKLGEKAVIIGKHGRPLEPPEVRGAQGDFSYYDLTKGSDFRQYCDSYAAFVKQFQDRIELFANIDAIGSPELTWQIQCFFEQEHGLRLVPVVHHGASLKWIDKYVERGYDIIGLGGFARKIGRSEVIDWTDKVFIHLCPASNHYKPIVRLHGFAITAWEYLTAWPWFSCDSTSWVKYSAYGWICMPRWIRGKFRYDRPPIVVNMSWRSPFKADRNKHLSNVTGSVKQEVMKWLEYTGIPLGKVDAQGRELKRGVISSHESRSAANLVYFTELQDSLPTWPWPLPETIRKRHSQRSGGFGLV